MNRMLAIGGVIVLAALGGLWWMTGQQPAPGLDLTGAASAQDAEVDLSLVKEMTLGNPDAPVTVIEYASYTCPHCRNFHATNFPKLKSEYIDTGKINFVYREVYFDRYGLWAGMLARCGGTPERYFALTSLIYENQQTWLASGDPAGISDGLRRLGKTAGLSDANLDACMQDSALAQALVASYQKNATEDGIRSTPSFVINGELYNNMAWEDFVKILDEAGAE